MPSTGHSPARGFCPANIWSAGYPADQILVSGRREHGVRMIGPVLPDNHCQAQSAEAFDVGCFAIDWEGQRATCAAGHASIRWSPTMDNRGKEMINIQFAGRSCRSCPQRARCVTARDGRRFSMRLKGQRHAMWTPRQSQASAAFRDAYDARAGVEGTISQGLRCCALHRVRYIGSAKSA